MIRRAKGTKQRNNAANSDALSRGSDDDASSFAEDDAVNRYFARSDSSSSFDPNSVLGLRNEYSKDLHSKEAQDESNLDNQSRDSVARKRSDTVTPQDMAVIGSLDGNTHRDASTEHGSSTLASYGNQGLPDGDDDSHAQISTSPTKRMSRIGATLSKLHFRSGSSATRREGGASVESSTPAHGLSRRASQESDVAFDFHKGSTSNHGHFMGRKHGSGKHTPVTRDATGDFAQFLQAEELKSKLAKEQDAAMKRELKFAKNPKKHKDYAGHGIGGKGKPETPEERWRRRHNVMTDDEDEYLPEGPTLEERGYFPGDLLHHGHLARRRTKGHGSKPTSSESSPQMQTHRIRPPGICGEVSDSNESDAEGESDAVDGDSEAPYLSTPADEKADIHANTGDNAQRKKTQRPSSISSESSYADSDIVEPHNANSAGGNINPSIMSLKSFKSDHSQGASTLSGGANAKLAKPLLELEELELDSFLKNFGRHTREIRVPHSANFPRRRMPRWEDFRIPPGEAALAKAQGKRVTVLTHVDRGLRALEAAEGEGVPKPRNEEAASDHKHLSSDAKPSKGKHKTKGDKLSASNSEADDLAPSRTSSSQGHPDRPLMTPASSTDKRSPLTTPHQRVSWAPAPEKEASRPGSPEVPLAGLRKNMLEKDEKEAKKQEQEGKDHPSFLSGFCGQEASEKSPSNVHAYDVEYRPSRDELDLNDQEWEMLHAPTEEVSAVDDDSQVDGVAWAIAYILATIERYAPEELDNSPDQRYRESKTRSHVERLYLIAPFWERLLYGIRRVYRWDNPRRTSSFMMTYFTLWYMNLLPTAFLLVVMYYTCQFRFFPPSASYLHEQVRLRMARGVDADRLAERLRRRSRLDVLEIYKRFVVAYGDGSQLACGDIADFHEKVKNLIVSKRTMLYVDDCSGPPCLTVMEKSYGHMAHTYFDGNYDDLCDLRIFPCHLEDYFRLPGLHVLYSFGMLSVVFVIWY